VVVQSGDLLRLSTVIVALTSTSAQPASFRPEVTIRGVRTRVLVDQIRAVEPSRLGRSAGVLAYDELSEVDTALETVLGLAR
jgi:mRNA interferase MazF